jgi:amidase
MVKRLITLGLFVLISGCAGTASDTSPEPGPSLPFDAARVDARSLAGQLADGRIDAVTVTRLYLERIATLDDSGPELNAIIEINPDALAIAEELDRRYAATGPVGPLHGVPVVLKANIDTADRMATSAGSLALAEHRAAKDAFLVKRLRDAGAVIIAKANLSEWANFRDSDSSSGWSSLGGQTRNPHVLDRNPCGSSSGSAVAVSAGLAPLAVGTETNGSIVCPSGASGIVGIKPTLGTVSRSGIIPIAHSQDTAGPMATNVADAALLLEVLVALDPKDPGAVGHPAANAGFVPPEESSLEGQRIGIFRSYFGAGQRPRTEAIFEEAVALLESEGAVLVDPIERTAPEGAGAAQYTVLTTEFRHDLDAYLAAAGLPPDRDSLEDLVAWNEAHADRVMPIFGQSIFIDSVATEGLDSTSYLEARALNNERMLEDVEGLLAEHDLDALFIPVNGPAWKTDWIEGDRYSFGGTSSLSAISGLPSVVLPAGTVEGLPVNVGFVGVAFSEAELIRMAHALEAVLPPRPIPGFVPSLEMVAE